MTAWANARRSLICGVSDTAGARRALETALDLSRRLELRLVVAHIAEGFASAESVSGQKGQQSAREFIGRLSDEYGFDGTVERRTAVGDPATILAQIATDENAELILIGPRTPRFRKRDPQGTLAHKLPNASDVPVLIAAPKK